MSSSNCENVPLMFKIDACIELVQTKFMDYSPIKKDLFYNYGILLEILSYFAKFYNSVTNIENCAIFFIYQLSQYCHYYDFQTNCLIDLY